MPADLLRGCPVGWAEAALTSTIYQGRRDLSKSATEEWHRQRGDVSRLPALSIGIHVLRVGADAEMPLLQCRDDMDAVEECGWEWGGHAVQVILTVFELTATRAAISSRSSRGAHCHTVSLSRSLAGLGT